MSSICAYVYVLDKSLAYPWVLVISRSSLKEKLYQFFFLTNMVKFALFSLTICMSVICAIICWIHCIFLLGQKVDTTNQYNSLQGGAICADRTVNASLVLYCKASWSIFLSILILGNHSLKHGCGFLMNKMYLNSNLIFCNVNCVAKIWLEKTT